MYRPLLAAVAASLTVPAVAADRSMSAALDKAIAGAHRSAASSARDAYRHPKQTLEFCGLRAGRTVVEISPSAGWYTEVIAPAMLKRGTYIAAHNNPAASPNAAKAVETFKAKLASDPVYAEVKVAAFGKGLYDQIAPAKSADLLLTFRNVHNWYIAGFAPEAFKAFYDTLKPGGTLCLEEHRLPESRSDEAMKSSGYMKVSAVKKLAADAGFKFVAESEINANAKDTADYPKGVWTLPPNYREGDTDRAKYTAIGESDRMTLRFVKPK
jgi:predicted methyltransferase